MKTQDKQDEFIRNLIRKNGIEKAPDHFTDKVMGRIHATPAFDNSPLFSKGTWIAIILGMAALIVFIFSVDIPYIDQVFSSSGIQKISMNIFSGGFFGMMSAFFKSLNISSISIMIVAAAVGLLVLERLLRRRFSETRVLVI
jgi:uncharacterized membrane protein YjjP (DUF1212 family)